MQRLDARSAQRAEKPEQPDRLAGLAHRQTAECPSCATRMTIAGTRAESGDRTTFSIVCPVCSRSLALEAPALEPGTVQVVGFERVQAGRAERRPSDS